MTLIQQFNKILSINFAPIERSKSRFVRSGKRNKWGETWKRLEETKRKREKMTPTQGNEKIEGHFYKDYAYSSTVLYQ